jgi:hypothetical protein
MDTGAGAGSCELLTFYRAERERGFARHGAANVLASAEADSTIQGGVWIVFVMLTIDAEIHNVPFK